METWADRAKALAAARGEGLDGMDGLQGRDLGPPAASSSTSGAAQGTAKSRQRTNTRQRTGGGGGGVPLRVPLQQGEPGYRAVAEDVWGQWDRLLGKDPLGLSTIDLLTAQEQARQRNTQTRDSELSLSLSLYQFLSVSLCISLCIYLSSICVCVCIRLLSFGKRDLCKRGYIKSNQPFLSQCGYEKRNCVSSIELGMPISHRIGRTSYCRSG